MARSASILNDRILKESRVSVKESATPLSEVLAANAHWLLRFGLASVFIYHGFQKFADLNGFATMMNLAYGVAFLVALAELVGGIFVIVGSFTRGWITRVGAAMFVPVMVGAIGMIHWPQWSFVPSATHPMGGMEFQVVLLLSSLYFVFKGNKS